MQIDELCTANALQVRQLNDDLAASHREHMLEVSEKKSLEHTVKLAQVARLQMISSCDPRERKLPLTHY